MGPDPITELLCTYFIKTARMREDEQKEQESPENQLLY